MQLDLSRFSPAERSTLQLRVLYEGAGYKLKGVFRGYKDCRMRTNEIPEFCPACRKATQELIEFYVK